MSNKIITLDNLNTNNSEMRKWVSERLSGTPVYRGSVSSLEDLESKIAAGRLDSEDTLKVGDYYRASSPFVAYPQAVPPYYDGLYEQVHNGDLIIYDGEASIGDEGYLGYFYDYKIDVIHSDDPGYYVTTNTDQEITSTKTFV